MQASLFQLTLSLIWSLGSDVPSIKSSEAIKRANEAFDIVQKNSTASSGIIAKINDDHRRTNAEIVGLGFIRAEVPIADVEKLIKEGLMHSLFGNKFALKNGPIYDFGKLSATDVRTGLFYPLSKQHGSVLSIVKTTK